MKKLADKGKATEKAVEDGLKKLNKSADTAYLRFPDSRSARNYLAAQPSDFFLLVSGVAVFLESKHTNHPERLAKDKFSQHAAMAKFQVAGSKGFLIVEHEAVGWRLVPVESLAFGVPSWSFKTFKIHPSAALALQELMQTLKGVQVESN